MHTPTTTSDVHGYQWVVSQLQEKWEQAVEKTHELGAAKVAALAVGFFASVVAFIFLSVAEALVVTGIVALSLYFLFRALDNCPKSPSFFHRRVDPFETDGAPPAVPNHHRPPTVVHHHHTHIETIVTTRTDVPREEPDEIRRTRLVQQRGWGNPSQPILATQKEEPTLTDSQEGIPDDPKIKESTAKQHGFGEVAPDTQSVEGSPKADKPPQSSLSLSLSAPQHPIGAKPDEAADANLDASYVKLDHEPQHPVGGPVLSSSPARPAQHGFGVPVAAGPAQHAFGKKA